MASLSSTMSDGLLDLAPKAEDCDQSNGQKQHLNNSTTRRSKRCRRDECYHCGSRDHRAKQCPTHDKSQQDDKRSSPDTVDLGSFGSIESIDAVSNDIDAVSNEFHFSATEKGDRFRYVELFAGIGGFRIALDRLGGQCVFASEIDRFARQCYAQNFNQIPAGDITKIHVSSIPDHDLLVGGFPCQSFSGSGRRKGLDEDRGVLFLEIVRILRAKRPKALLLENVRGLTTHDNGETLSIILSHLEDTGYTIHYDVLDAVNIVPQERKRLYIVGIRNDLLPRQQDAKKHDNAILSRACSHCSCYTFPTLPTLHRGFQDIAERQIQSLLDDNEGTKVLLESLTLSDHQLNKVLAQSYTKKFPHARFLFDVSLATKTLQSSYAKYMVGSQFVPLGVISTEKDVAGVDIKAHDQTFSNIHDGNSAKRNGVPDDEDDEATIVSALTIARARKWRKFTPREAARLQGFPESFQLCQVRPYHSLGNAVIPSMICFVMSGGVMDFLLVGDGSGGSGGCDDNQNDNDMKGNTGDSIDVAGQAGDLFSHGSDGFGKSMKSDEYLRCQRAGVELLLESCPDDERKQSLKYLLDTMVS